ncbi:MAG: FAD-dependent oxidoreductase, partial [Saprospiraceae bacterium]
MNTPDYDLVIIGCGPAGSTTARIAAERGLRVLLVDKRQELGAPIQCSGALSANALEEAGIEPAPEFVHAPVYGFDVYNEAGEQTTIDYRQLKPDKYGSEPGKKPL